MVQIDHHEYLSEEEKRLKEDRERTKYWKKWGPYVAERQWATGIALAHPSGGVESLHTTVREDYSADGDAWSRRFPFSSSNSNHWATIEHWQIFPMSMLVHAPFDGEKMVFPVSPIPTACRMLHSPFGTRKSMLLGKF